MIWRRTLLIDDSQPKQLIDKTKSTCFFTHKVLKAEYKCKLDSHQINHTSGKLTISQKKLESGRVHVKTIVQEKANIYARKGNQNNLKYPLVFSTKLHEQDEDDQVLNEVEFYNNLNINRVLTQSDIGYFGFSSQLENLMIKKLLNSL